MKKILVLTLLLCVFCYHSASADEELTEREWEIYYDYEEALERVSDGEEDLLGFSDRVAERHNITYDEAHAIHDRGESIKLTDRQWEIYDEYARKRKEIKDEYKPIYEGIMEEVAAKYGMTTKKLDESLGTYYYYKYVLLPEHRTAEVQKETEEINAIYKSYSDRHDPVERREKQEIRDLEESLASKYGIRRIAVVDIYIKGNSQAR